MSIPGLELTTGMMVPPPPLPPAFQLSEPEDSPEVPVTCKPGDYSILRFLQEGVMGKVFSGKRKTDNKQFAMKFFGYTRQLPRLHSVIQEISLMRTLAGIEGVIQLQDVFMDTQRGMVVGRHSVVPYPVIVMELCLGGDMFDRINQRCVVSEQALAKLFKRLVLAVDSLHARRFLHRDLKPENVMLAEDTDYSQVKLIDFGMMVQLAPGCTEYNDICVRGTPGYYAPETLHSSHQYSTKSDMWQLGCILYATLSGLMAFGPNSNDMIAIGRYEDMVGFGWDTISSAAKDLVSKLLALDPSARLDIKGVLGHPWITSEETPSVYLGEDYFARVKYLSLRQRLKNFFVESNIVQENQVRRKRLEEAVPLLASPSYGTLFNYTEESFNNKLRALKRVALEVLRSQSGQKICDPPYKKLRPCTAEFDYFNFVKAMTEAGLAELGCPQVFRIFDIDGSGSIDLKEFLLTIIAFRPAPQNATDCNESVREAAGLYFDVFDLDSNGMIDLEEMRLVVSCVLLDEMVNPTTLSATPASSVMEPKSYSSSELADIDGETDIRVETVDDLFREFDKSKDGQIDFEEFLSLYQALLRNVSDRKSHMSVC